jgi:hypothetical protein
VVRKSKLRSENRKFKVRKYSYSHYNQYGLSKEHEILRLRNEEGNKNLLKLVEHYRTGVKR